MSFPLSKIKCTKCDFSHTDFPRGIILKYILNSHEFLTGYRTTGWCYNCNGIQDIEKLCSIQECQSELEELQSKIKSLKKEIAGLNAGFLGRALKKSKISDLENELNDAKQEFAETEKKLRWISKRKSGARCLHCGSDQTKALAFKLGTDGRHIAQGFTHSCGGQLFIVDVEDGPRFAVSPITIVLDMEGNILPADKPKPKIQNVPKNLQTGDIDEEILEFQEEYPDLYDFVLRVLDGTCDKPAVQAFKDDYGEEILNDILKIISGKALEKDIQAFLEDYGDEIYNPILKMIQNRKPQRKDLPKAIHGREKFKKGDFIGQKYEVFDVLGEGGFGIVYLVYSHETNSPYALKTFRDEYLEDVTTRERFKKEAQVWIELERHPYLVRAHFVDDVSGRLFIGMEHIAPDDEGLNTLEGYLRRRPPDLAQSLKWAIQFCYGMEHAYSKGIKAHRDIKPANIMITQDKIVKISDFGLAGVIGESKAASGIKIDIRQGNVGFSCQTMEGVGFGTPTHMPPEQFINAAGCDERSDIYSFGIVLYQMASGGKLPFLATLPRNDEYEESRRFWIEMYKLHGQEPIPKINTPLSQIILRCLEKNPSNRYFSFKELRRDFETLLKKQTGEVIKLPEIKEMEAWELYNKGFSFGVLGKYQEAIACYDKALEINPIDAEAWHNKGNALGGLGKPQEAIACYDRSLAINPRHAGAWYGKGGGLLKLNKHQEAIGCYDRALEINPKYAHAWSCKGIALSRLDKHQEAIACYDMFLQLNPRNSFVWRIRGVSLSEIGKHREARASFEQSLEIDPNQADIWFVKGTYLGDNEIYEEAIICYDRVLEIDPKHFGAWYNKGFAFLNLGKHKETIACYNKVLEIEPQNAVAWHNKGESFKALGMYKDAIEAYKNFIRFVTPKHAGRVEKVKEIIRQIGGIDCDRGK